MKQRFLYRPYGAATIAGLYAIFGTLWILFSDRFVEAMAESPEQLSRLQTLKGWGYVVVTAFLIFIMIRIYEGLIRKIENSYQGELQRQLTSRTVELNRTQKKLVERKKNQALSDLMVGFAHEINTPLGVSVTAVSTLRHSLAPVLTAEQMSAEIEPETELPRQVSSLLDLLETNLQRTVALVESIRRLRAESWEPQIQQVQLNRFLPNTIQTRLKDQFSVRGAEGRIQGVALEEFAWEFSSEQIVNVVADVEVLRFIFNCLIDNLFDHGLKHNTGTEKQDESPPYFTVSLSAEGNEVYISYRDYGPRVPPEQLDRLVEPFYSVNRKAGNSGLGLSIVYSLVVQVLEGSMSIASPENQGLEVMMIFPASKETV